MLIRLGISRSFRRFSAAAAEMGAPIMVSANAFRRSRGGFRKIPHDLFGGADVALDSAGFVAMVKYRGYPWSVEQYVALAAQHPWAWWSSMDYCCEPEIARDREEVLARVQRTADMLAEVRREAFKQGAPPPMPVLQGWRPADYEYCIERMGAMPDPVGLGSVCRHAVGGPEGIVAIVERLDRVLPKHTRLHLFGVKGTAIPLLMQWERVASVDSMAWDFRSRKAAREAGHLCRIDFKLSEMRRWYGRQQQHRASPRPAQLELVA